MTKSFFEPYVGPNYENGINGKKVLVVGASFYCNHKDCLYFKDCTDVNVKDSSRFNKCCPEYNKDDVPLSRTPQYEIHEGHKTYRTFAKSMCEILNLKSDSDEDYYDAFWNRVAFTNFVQYFLPRWKTLPSDCTDRDLEALCEVIKEKKPDIVIIWGTVTSNLIKSALCYDSELQDNTSGYICHSNVIDDNCVIVLNTYHPSYSRFKDNGNLEKYVRMAFEQ